MPRTPLGEVPGEEPLRALQLERGHPAVAAEVGVQRFLGRAEAAEQRKDRLARHQFVVPLEQELDRDGDPRHYPRQ